MNSAKLFSFLSLIVFSSVCLQASPIITFQVTTLDAAQHKFRYNYSVSGVDLLAGEDIDIQFKAANYGTLSNEKALTAGGQSDTDFHLVKFQPNSPVGASGDLIAFATVDHPSFAGTFSIDFIYLAADQSSVMTNVQTFFLFDDRVPGVSMQIGSSGMTTAAPEPSSFGVSAVGSLVLLAGFALRRQARR